MRDLFKRKQGITLATTLWFGQLVMLTSALGQSQLPGSANHYPSSYGSMDGVRHVQAQPGDMGLPPLPPGSAPGPIGAQPSIPEYTLPAAAQPFGAGGPPQALEPYIDAPAAGEGEPELLLMQALGIEDNPFMSVYGWIQNSFTANPSFPADRINFGVTPNYRSNDWLGNQYYTVFEKPLTQDDRIHFGYRFDFLFGHDWEFNAMQGVFDNAFRPGQFTGIDLPQFFGEVHLPILTEGGLDVRFGRWYTLHGYEVVPAVARPLLSVPYMFTFGQPFTHWGLMTTWNVSDQLVVYNGSPQGWDTFQNQNMVWTYMGGFSWTSRSERLNLTHIYSYAVNQFHKLEVAQETGLPVEVSNRGYTGNFTHLWTTVLSIDWNDRITQVVENDLAFENNVPTGDLGPNGAVLRDNSQWYSLGNWFFYEFTDKLTGVWRSEVFRDHGGFRTGFSDNFYQMTLGLIAKPCPNLWIRPEARYDWAQFSRPYNDGNSTSQFTYGFDVILLY